MSMIGGPNFTKKHNKFEPFRLDMYVFLAMPCGPKIKFENNEILLATSFKNLRKIF
jgi:hypothetical protein